MLNCCRTAFLSPCDKDNKETIKNTPITIPIVVSQDLTRLVEMVFTAILKYSFRLLKFIFIMFSHFPAKEHLCLENGLKRSGRLEYELYCGCNGQYLGRALPPQLFFSALRATFLKFP